MTRHYPLVTQDDPLVTGHNPQGENHSPLVTGCDPQGVTLGWLHIAPLGHSAIVIVGARRAVP
ncbi:MAG: hypothetical protein Q3M30_11530 [Candidatus Electrothrix sp. Rat3]|nr:hypothetical protein [Candidatus Electrothrix rattekaaiensis]